MFRLFLIAFLLTGCATTTNKPLSMSSKDTLGKIGVISTIGNDLLCAYRGITIFTNYVKKYEIPSEINTLFTSEIVKQLSFLNYNTVPLNSNLITYKKAEKGAVSFDNIKLNESIISSKAIDTIVIYDGNLTYNSQLGYNARNNALNTSSGIYVYNLPSKKLVGVSTKLRNDLKRKFSCNLSALSIESGMYTLIEESGLETQKELIENIF